MLERNWQALIKPYRIRVRMDEDEKFSASMTFGPLEPGLGITIGNALRRVLLSSIRGAAVTEVQFKGVLHEFSTLPGVREDVTQIVLNLKKLNIRFDGEEPKRVRLEAHGPRVVTAAMFETSSSVDFTTPDQVICTLVGDDSQVSLEVVVESGKGYSPAGQRDRSNVPLGTVLVDALFNPVRNVAFSVSNTRVGQATNYDNLTLNVKTNGSLSPEDAVGAASKILQEQLKRFVNFQEDVEKATVERAAEAKLPFNRSLLKKVNELDLSLRASNCLARENIIYIGDLVTRSEADLLKTPNFGRKSLNEINELLKPMGLYLGMEVKEWPPEDIDGLMKSLDETFPATRG